MSLWEFCLYIMSRENQVVSFNPVQDMLAYKIKLIFEHKAQILLVEIPKGIMMIQTYTSLYIQLLTQIQASTLHGGFGLSEGRKASVPIPFQTKSDKHHTIPVTNDPKVFLHKSIRPTL